MQLHLVDLSPEIVEAWQRAFDRLDNVSIACGNILELAEDTIVSPANGYGYIDGGIDRIYRDFFGSQIERSVRDSIEKNGRNREKLRLKEIKNYEILAHR